jgi:cardiolipin synthase
LVLWAVGLPPRIKPIFISKANTAVQILLAALVLLLSGFGFSAPILMEVMIWLVAATTFASGAAYVVQAARRTAGWNA